MRIIDPPHGAIMAIAAHPDDIESWCAGTLARAIAGGALLPTTTPNPVPRYTHVS